MDGIQLPQGWNHFEKAVFTFKFPEIPGIHFIDLKRMKDWVNLEPPSGFKHGTSGLGIQCLDHEVLFAI